MAPIVFYKKSRGTDELAVALRICHGHHEGSLSDLVSEELKLLGLKATWNRSREPEA